MCKKMMYCLLEFAETNEVAVAPFSWLNEKKTKCQWPPFKSYTRLTACVIKAEVPAAHWSTHDVRCLHIFDSYDEARKKLAAAEMMSDLATKLSDEGDCSKYKKHCIRADAAEVSSDSENELSAPLLSVPASSSSAPLTPASESSVSASIPSTFLQSFEKFAADPPETKVMQSDSGEEARAQFAAAETSDLAGDLLKEEEGIKKRRHCTWDDGDDISSDSDDKLSLPSLTLSFEIPTLVNKSSVPVPSILSTHANESSISASIGFSPKFTAFQSAESSVDPPETKVMPCDSHDEAKEKFATAWISDLAMRHSGKREDYKKEIQYILPDTANISSDSEDKSSASLQPLSPKVQAFGNKTPSSVPAPSVSSTSGIESPILASVLFTPPPTTPQTFELSYADSPETNVMSSGINCSSNNLIHQGAEPCSCCRLIMTEIHEMKLLMEYHTHLLSEFLERNNGSTDAVVVRRSLPVCIKGLIPLSSVDDLKLLNDFLADEANFVQCRSYFSTLGGNNTKDAARRVLQHMISHEVSLQMNWKGRGYKQAFQNYQNVINLIYRSVIQIPLCQMTTLCEIETEIKNWLRFAADRYGGRSKRNSSQTQISCV